MMLLDSGECASMRALTMLLLSANAEGRFQGFIDALNEDQFSQLKYGVTAFLLSLTPHQMTLLTGHSFSRFVPTSR